MPLPRSADKAPIACSLRRQRNSRPPLSGLANLVREQRRAGLLEGMVGRNLPMAASWCEG